MAHQAISHTKTAHIVESFEMTPIMNGQESLVGWWGLLWHHVIPHLFINTGDMPQLFPSLHSSSYTVLYTFDTYSFLFPLFSMIELYIERGKVA